MKDSFLRLRRLALPATVLLAATLTACSISSAAPLDKITVTGEGDVKPELTFETPLEADAFATKVLEEGDGDELAEGDAFTISYVFVNGNTGDELFSNGWDGAAPEQFGIDSTFPTGINKSFEGVPVGSRVLSILPPEEFFGAQGNTQLGLDGSENVVLLADIVEKLPDVPDRADGEPQEPVAGLPTVELDEDGRPTVTIPESDPPAELTVGVLQKGDGEVVEETDTVVVQYQGVNWRTGEVFDESWARGEPSTFPLSSLVPGFTQGVAGQTVGSQVIISIPSELGYATGNDGAGIEVGDTIVFVVDILGIR